MTSKRVAGAVAQIEVAAVVRVLHGGLDADSGALVPRVGQGGHPKRGRAVQGGEGVDAGGGDVVDRAGLGGRDPDREPAGQGDGLDVAAVPVSLPGVPQVNGLALDAGGLLPAPVRGDDLAVRDHERGPLGHGPGQRLRQFRRPRLRRAAAEITRAHPLAGPDDVLLWAEARAFAA